jgi:hypothetical protein
VVATVASPIQAALAAVQRRPALVIAGAGVAAVALVASVGRRRSEEQEAAAVGPAVAGGAVAPIAGYGAGLTQPLPGPDYGYSDETARGNAAIVNAIAAQTAAVTTAIAAQAARTPTVPAKATPKPAPAQLPADLGTIVIGLRQRYPAHYQAWLKYAGAGGVQPKTGESSAQRRARLQRELAYYTARITRS